MGMHRVTEQSNIWILKQKEHISALTFRHMTRVLTEEFSTVFMGCKLLFHYPVDTGGRAAGA
jgi:hypothetical protein